MAEPYKHTYDVDLNQSLKRFDVGDILASGDEKANSFEVSVYRDGTEVPLTGYTVTGYFIQPNEETLRVSGTATGNTACVEPSKGCYVYDGAFSLAIKITGDGFAGTVAVFDGRIVRTTSENIVDGDRVIYGLEDLLAQIAATEAAANNANTAAGNADNATARANQAASAIENITVSAIGLATGEEATAAVTNGSDGKHIHFGIPRGEKGEKGDPGTIENVTITSIAGLPEALAGKLPSDGTAVNADKLGGVSADEYALKTSILGKIQLANVKSILRTDVVDSTWYLQGGVWVDSINAFIIAFRSSEEVAGTTEVLLAVCDEYFNVTMTKQVNGGHANDIAYCQYTNRIYIATGDHGANANTIIKVNPYYLEVESVHSFDYPCWQISYNRTGRYFLANFGGKLRKLDEELNIISEVNWSLPDYFDGKYTTQGSFFYDDRFYLVGYAYNEIIIIEVDENGNALSKFIENIGANESEIVAVRNDELFVFAGQNVLKSFKADLKNESVNALSHFNNAGATLSTGDDLNIIGLNVGKYNSASGAMTAGLLNKPSTLTSADGGFTLIVQPLAFDRFVNFIVAANGRIFKRAWSHYTGWFDWEEIGGDVEDSNVRTSRILVNGEFHGLITASSTQVCFAIPSNGKLFKGTPTITEGNFAVRANGAYLVAIPTVVSEACSNVTISQNELVFYITLTLNTALDASCNNSVCSVWCSFYVSD